MFRKSMWLQVLLENVARHTDSAAPLKHRYGRENYAYVHTSDIITYSQYDHLQIRFYDICSKGVKIFIYALKIGSDVISRKDMDRAHLHHKRLKRYTKVTKRKKIKKRSKRDK